MKEANLTFDLMSPIGLGPRGPQGPQGIQGPMAQFANPVEWSNTRSYDPLTIVTYQGNSYTSRKRVPKGIDINDARYWVETGNYNAQVEAYRQETLSFANSIHHKAFAFENVAAMQESTQLYVGAICHTNGFHDSWDGGAAWYVVSDSGEANGIDILECNSLIAVLVLSNNISVKTLGAYGDNVHDDTDIIKRGLEIANSQLYFDAGEYRITDSLHVDKLGFTLSGAGKNDAVLHFYFPPFSEVVTNNYCIIMNSARDVTIKGLAFNGNESAFDTQSPVGAYHIFQLSPTVDNGVTDIAFYDCYFTRTYDNAINTTRLGTEVTNRPVTSNIKIDKCVFETIGVHGIGMNNASKVVVTNCYFHNVGIKGIFPPIGSGLAVDFSAGCDDCIASGNIVDGAGGGFKCETHTRNDSTTIPSYNIIFTNNIVKNLDTRTEWFYGIRANGINVTIEGNIIESYMHGILIGTSAANCVVSNNTIRLVNDAPSACGIKCDTTLQGIRISNNTISDAKSAGIITRSSNTIIEGNIVSNCVTSGIRVANGTDIIISSNATYDCANTGISISPISGTIENVILIGNSATSTNGVQERGVSISAAALNVKAISNLAHGNTISDFGYNYASAWSLFNSQKITYSNAAPTAGEWNRGDIVINNYPASNVPFAWICISAGTPGTWKDLISA